MTELAPHSFNLTSFKSLFFYYLNSFHLSEIYIFISPSHLFISIFHLSFYLYFLQYLIISRSLHYPYHSSISIPRSHQFLQFPLQNLLHYPTAPSTPPSLLIIIFFKISS